jgi:hypothetical protein
MNGSMWFGCRCARAASRAASASFARFRAHSVRYHEDEDDDEQVDDDRQKGTLPRRQCSRQALEIWMSVPEIEEHERLTIITQGLRAKG